MRLRKKIRRSGIVFVFLLFAQPLFSQQGFDCYTIIAGKNATKSGSIMLAHNEDDYGENILSMHALKNETHPKGKLYKLKNGAKLREGTEAYAALWMQMPGQDFADCYVNEHAVCIVSNACPSRENEPETENGGIGYYLRRIMARNASTAREAVELAGRLIETYGYDSPGRSYSIADKNEAWVMAVVHGKHWVAQRVPDNEVMFISNYYTIQEVDLDDKENYLGSSDLINYAIERKWYNPDKDDKFNFRKAYGKPESLAHPGNIMRKWQGLSLVTEAPVPLNKPMPFSVQTERKLDATDFMRILENHYEGTEFDESQRYRCGNPHEGGINAICSDINQYGFVAELREDIPEKMGVLLWLAFRRPCIQPFIPVYSGTNDFPGRYHHSSPEKALDKHFVSLSIDELGKQHAFVDYISFAKLVDENYAESISDLKTQKRQLEKEYTEMAAGFEEKYKKIENQEKADTALNDFTELVLSMNHDKIRRWLTQHRD
ncbi:MAG: C69 family dipeptidase [Bacteroidota bacterium]